MTTYFTARKAEKVFADYKNTVLEYWKSKTEIVPMGRRRSVSSLENQQSFPLRERLIGMYPEARMYADMLGVCVSAQSYPAPMIGGPIVHVDFLYAAIDPDQGHARISERQVLDTINLCLATATATRKRRLWGQLLNPVWWIVATIGYLLRIPFLILRSAGLPPKVEESTWGHIMKVLFFAVLVLMSLHWGLKLSPENVLKFFK
jgi:hypothetical protein